MSKVIDILCKIIKFNCPTYRTVLSACHVLISSKKHQSILHPFCVALCEMPTTLLNVVVVVVFVIVQVRVVVVVIVVVIIQIQKVDAYFKNHFLITTFENNLSLLSRFTYSPIHPSLPPSLLFPSLAALHTTSTAT